jgi:hypothetical protein
MLKNCPDGPEGTVGGLRTVVVTQKRSRTWQTCADNAAHGGAVDTPGQESSDTARA